ncbi:MAG: hypothetical protein ACN4GZ_19680 [Acidimicrobiales bacterium]
MPVILGSARKHGKTNDDILHAWNNALGFYIIGADHEPPKSLAIGPDLAGNLLEVIYLELEEADVIIHAMTLQPKYLPLLGDTT